MRTNRFCHLRIGILVFASTLAFAPTLSRESLGILAQEVSPAALFDLKEGIKSRGHGFGTVKDKTEGGLILYGYKSRSKASFHPVMSGLFHARSASLASDYSSFPLENYSFLFEGLNGEGAFKIGVLPSADYNNVYVEVNEKRAGINYCESWKGFLQYGTTKGYNAMGEYTKGAAGFADLTFDPETMQVRVVSPKNGSVLVWDLGKEVNDDAFLESNLKPFDLYRVSVCFESVAPVSQGRLLLSDFGGYSFNAPTIEANPSLSVSFNSKAVVGETYLLPDPVVYSPSHGEVSGNDADVAVYSEEGTLLTNVGERSFTPTSPGTYYVAYTYDKNKEKASKFVRLQVIAKEQKKASFHYSSPFKNNENIGLNSARKLPYCLVESDLFTKGDSLPARLRVIRDGQVVDSKGTIPKEGLDYVFEVAGNYTISYELPQFNFVDEKYVTVSADVPSFRLPKAVQDSYDLGSELLLEGGVVYFKGKTIHTDVSLLMPSGTVHTNDKASLNELGTYSLLYQYKIDGVEHHESKSFVVQEPFSDLFVSESSRVKATYGSLNYADSQKGMNLTLTGNQAATFSKEIDLSSYAFNDSDGHRYDNAPLIEAYANPRDIGTSDAEGFYVVLSDVNDETNAISIRMKEQTYSNKCSRIRAKAPGQGYAGIFTDCFSTGMVRLEGDQGHEDGGYMSPFHFSGVKTDAGNFRKERLELYYDYKETALYANPWHEDTHLSDESQNFKVSWKVRDFDSPDEADNGGDLPWGGFSSSKVKVSFFASGVSSSADFMITKIGDYDLSNPSVIDKNPPTLTINHRGEDGYLPEGKVNIKYPLPSAEAKDDYTSSVTLYKEVYFNNSQVDLIDGESFVPTAAGEYKVIYFARDGFGNTKSQMAKIKISNTLSKPKIDLLGELPTYPKVGEVVKLPTPKVTGGSGIPTLTIKITCKGKDIPISDGGIRLIYEGNYLIQYKAVDYLGQTSVLVKNLNNVRKNDEIIVDESPLNVPEILLENTEVEIPSLYGFYYDGVNAKPLKVIGSVTIEDGSGTKNLGHEGKYIPKIINGVKTATLTYSFVTAGMAEKKVARVLPIRSIEAKKGFMADYFLIENGTATIGNDLRVTPNQASPTKVSYLKTVLDEAFKVAFEIDFECLTLTLADSSNQEEKLAATFTKDGSNTLCSINGSPVSFVPKSGNTIEVGYSEAHHTLVDSRRMPLSGAITKPNGQPFQGFSSHQIRVSFVFEAPLGSQLILKSLGTQSLTILAKDTAGPSLLVHGSISGFFKVGESLELPSAAAWDALSEIKEVTYSISKDGEEVASGDARLNNTFTPQSFGQYVLTYRAVDSSRQENSSSFYFSVASSNNPSLRFASEIPSSIKINDSFEMPKYTIVADDPNSVSVSIFVEDPDGLIKPLNDYVFLAHKKGRYTITYIAEDSSGLVSFASFGITVS